MIRTRLALTALALLAAATVHAGAPTPVNFGPTELGQIQTGCFTVCFGNGCSGSGTISSINVGSPFFVRGIRTAGENSDPCNTGGVSTPRNLPVNVSPNQLLVFDVDLVPTTPGNFNNRPLSVNGDTLWNLSTVVNPHSGCVESPTANCLQNNRFKARVHWRTDFGTRGAGPVVPVSSNDSGLFYFFNANNWEMLLKVLNGCPINDRYWVFAAATTNVEFTITVTDTQTQSAKSYFKPRGQAAPAITDTEAFATCP